MATNDSSQYVLRYNEISQAVEFGSGTSWNAIALVGTVTGHATLDLALTGGSLTGPLTFTGTTFALTPPKLTTTQQNALVATEGMVIYNTTDHTLAFYNGTAWKEVATV